MHNLIPVSGRGLAWDLFNDFDDVVGGFFRPAAVVKKYGASLVPALDITETETAYVIQADLPGVRRDDLSVSIKDGLLSINAAARYEHDEKKHGRLLRQERRYGKYVRTLRLGEDVDANAISAAYDNGVLKLTLPKVANAQPRKIDISVH